MTNIDDNINLDSKNIPLGSIVESGSNENGNWIKFYDGTMICYGSKQFVSVNFTATHQSWYFKSERIPFPQSFIGAPIENATILRQEGLWGISLYNNNKDSFSAYIFTAKERTDITFVVNYIAIGRWK